MKNKLSITNSDINDIIKCRVKIVCKIYTHLSSTTFKSKVCDTLWSCSSILFLLHSLDEFRCQFPHRERKWNNYVQQQFEIFQNYPRYVHMEFMLPTTEENAEGTLHKEETCGYEPP